ncbi:MAG TPA: SpoIID/LytB domain-containing protein, partial [Cryptosporangiaceae bacterium]|nr:SpoIID/LytB domain-containing protein [Cryptosporangiaceae bacterium]
DGQVPDGQVPDGGGAGDGLPAESRRGTSAVGSQAVSVGNGVASIYTRAEWGAPPVWMTWKPTYAPAVKAVVIHHTATGNSYRPGDVPAILRSIYRFHAISQKWGDIGYNVLVDRFGRAWEGRYGGLRTAVVGAHTGGFNTRTAGISMLGDFTRVRPTAQALRTVVRVAAWKLGSYGVNPRGTTSLTGGPNTRYPTRVTITVPTMFPHRRTNATACPGNVGVLWMKWLRWRTAELLARKRVMRATSVPGPVPGWTSVPTGGLTAWGKGFGHGRGMSQYGAQAAAAKLTAAQITQFYYPGTTRAPIGNPVVRVRLRAVDAGHLVLRPPPGATRVTGLVALGGGRRVALPPQTGYHVVRSGNTFVIQKPAGSGWASVLVLSAPVSFVGPPVLRLQYNRAKAGCKGGYLLTYSGNLRATLVGGVPYFVATMRMETYLRGVVSSEMPATWRPAAVQAQAMAARTYARSRMDARRFYDVHDTTADQCWDGHASYHPATDAAIRATAGLVIAYRGVPINAQYSADNGGRTAPGGQPYLPDKADPYAGSSGSPYLRWTVTLTPAAMAGLDGPGGITSVRYLRVVRRTGAGVWGGRIVAIMISDGVRPPVTVSGDRFRFGLGLRSTYVGFSPG